MSSAERSGRQRDADAAALERSINVVGVEALERERPHTPKGSPSASAPSW